MKKRATPTKKDREVRALLRETYRGTPTGFHGFARRKAAPPYDRFRAMLEEMDVTDINAALDVLDAALACHSPLAGKVESFRRALLIVGDSHELERIRALAEELEHKTATRHRPTAAPAKPAKERKLTLRAETINGHGPYWYGYLRTSFGPTKKYFGLKKPDTKAVALAIAEITALEQPATKRAEPASASAKRAKASRSQSQATKRSG